MNLLEVPSLSCPSEGGRGGYPCPGEAPLVGDTRVAPFLPGQDLVQLL